MSQYNRCTECLRDMQIILPHEKPNPSYVCVDCRAQNRKPMPAFRTLTEILADTELMWRAKFTSLGLQVAKKPFQINRDGVITPMWYGRALSLQLRDKPEKAQEFRYSFHLDLTKGTWNRAGMTVLVKNPHARGKRMPQAWFAFDTLKRYGLEAVIAK